MTASVTLPQFIIAGLFAVGAVIVLLIAYQLRDKKQIRAAESEWNEAWGQAEERLPAYDGDTYAYGWHKPPAGVTTLLLPEFPVPDSEASGPFHAMPAPADDSDDGIDAFIAAMRENTDRTIAMLAVPFEPQW